jgi:hypothetical protein
MIFVHQLPLAPPPPVLPPPPEKLEEEKLPPLLQELPDPELIEVPIVSSQDDSPGRVSRPFC